MIFPDYKANCFSNLPILTKVFFGLEGKDKLPISFKNKRFLQKQNLIFLFIDSFGWRFIEKYQAHPFLKKLIRYGQLVKATSQFPSTTAAHVTTINVGLPVGEHGVHEWFYYEPEVDKIIAPLLFSLAGPKEGRGNLESYGVSPERLFPFKTLYEELKEFGIKSYTFGFKEFTPSPYSNVVFKGAEKVIPYSTLPEAITNLFEILYLAKGRSYFYLYFEKIDSINHVYGPSSSQSEAEIIAFLEIMDKVFWPKFEKVLKNTSFVLFADHGQIEVDPQRTFYLNREVPSIEKYLRTNKEGRVLAPAGSPRDMFLYVKEELLEETEGVLKKKLAGIAEVVRTEEFVKKGYFGEKVSERFLERVGNLILLPYPGETVWWYEKDRFEMRYFGHHGGLSAEEMEIGVGVV